MRTRSTSPVTGRWLSGIFALHMLTVAASPADAQRRAVPPSKEAVQLSFAPIVKKAAPAVVNVFVKGRPQQPPQPQARQQVPIDDPVFRRFFGELFGMPDERMQNSLGSGVIVSADGIVVTNTHVIKIGGQAEIRIVLADKREFDAKVVSQDEKTDIAVLKIEGGDGRLPFLEFEDSDSLEVGDMVLAIGNPFGVGQTVTQGIVSALARTEIGKSEAQVFIQTDAAINPGNSGGALVDMAGRLVGINTAIYSRSGGSHGIGFAIPSNLVRLFADSAISGPQGRAALARRQARAGHARDRRGPRPRPGDRRRRHHGACREPGCGRRSRARRRHPRRRRPRGRRSPRRALPADHARHRQQRPPRGGTQGPTTGGRGGAQCGPGGRAQATCAISPASIRSTAPA